MSSEHLPKTLAKIRVTLVALATTAGVNLQKYHAMPATTVTPILLHLVLKAKSGVQQANQLRVTLVMIALQVRPVNSQIWRLDAMKDTFALEEQRLSAQIVRPIKAAMFVHQANTVPTQ